MLNPAYNPTAERTETANSAVPPLTVRGVSRHLDIGAEWR